MRSSRSRGIAVTATSLGCASAALVAWELAAQRSTNFRLLASSPSLVFDHILTHPDNVWLSLLTTGLEAILGLLCAIAASLSIAPFLALWPRTAAYVYPWLMLSQVIPLVALAPLVVVLFGPGEGGKVVLSALMAFFPILANLLSGFRHIPPAALTMYAVLNASWRIRLVACYVPHCLPHFFAGLRVATPIAVIGAIVAEFNGAARGVGKDVFIAAKRLEPEIMMTGLLSSAVLGTGLYAMVVLVEDRIGPWYRRNA